MTRHEGELLPQEVGPIAVNVVLQPLALSDELLSHFLLLLLVLSAADSTKSAHAPQSHVSRLGHAVVPAGDPAAAPPRPVCRVPSILLAPEASPRLH